MEPAIMNMLDVSLAHESPQRQNGPTGQSADDTNIERGVQEMPNIVSPLPARETNTLSRTIQDSSSRDDDIQLQLHRILPIVQEELAYLYANIPVRIRNEVLLGVNEVGGRSRGLTRDQINRIPTRVFKSGTGPDTTKSKSCERLTRNAANPGTTSTEEQTVRAKVDDGDSKGANGVKAMDAMKECNICLSEFVNNDKLRILTCFHEFHITCIDEWIKDHTTCPLCRAQVQI